MNTAAEDFVEWLMDQIYDLDTSADPWGLMPEQLEELINRVDKKYRIVEEPQ